MRQNGFLMGVLVPVAALLGACGGGGSGGDGGGGAGTGTTTNFCDALEPISNPDSCKAQGSEVDCSLVTKLQKYDDCGVAQKAPPKELARSSTVMEYGGTGDPQVSCFDPATFPDKPGTPEMVTIKGTAVIFSHGCSSNDLKIEVYTVARGGSNDGDLGSLVGSPVITDADCSINGVASAEETCDPSRYECTFEYPGVPTETELVIKTSGDLYAPLYDYNIFIRNSDVNAGVWSHDVRALAADDYGVIAQVALGASITPGNGAIAGEVHDCGDVRLQNAVVDTNVFRKVLSYFGNDEAHPLPDLSGQATSTLGLYTALDISPGPASIAAMGKTKDGKLIGLGFLRVRVFPDSVTTVTFRGMNPILVP